MSPATKRQKQVLEFVKGYAKLKGYAPSLDEIRRHFRFASVSTAHFHMRGLQAAGLVERQPGRHRSANVSQSETMVRIPLLGTIAAGQPIEVVAETESIAVPRSRIGSQQSVYALRVVGNSMIDEGINDGDVVLVRHQDTAENGQKVVALLDHNYATLKKFYREKGVIRLQPANKTVEPIIVRNGSDITIQGVVLDVVRNGAAFDDRVMGAEAPARPVHQTSRGLEEFVNQVIEANCLDVMPLIPDRSVDMILCDLPYGTTQNGWDSVIPLDLLWAQYERIIKDAGAIVLTGQGLFSARLIVSNPRLFKYKITWVKSKPTNFLNAKKQPLRKHEDILIFYKQQPSYSPQMSEGEPYNKGFRKDQLTGSYGDFKTVEVKSDGKRYPTDVIYFKTAESEGQVYHPTQKPVELGRYLIRTFTKPGAIVMDNTCGSGSFLVSAVLEGRHFIGIEKNQEVLLHKKDPVDYIAVCKKRIAEARREVQSDSR